MKTTMQQLVQTKVANLFKNQGEKAVIGANNLSLTVTNDFENKENAMITGNNLSIATSRLNNDASITANSYSATADSFSNQGKIIVGGDFNLSIEENTINNKEIHTGGNLNITTQNFTNKNLILAGNIDIQTTGDFLNQRGSIYSYGGILLTAGVSTDGITFFKSNSFTNEGGWIESIVNLEIHSNSILNTVSSSVDIWVYDYNEDVDKSVSYRHRGGTRTWTGTFLMNKQIQNLYLEENRGRIYSDGNIQLIANAEIINDYSKIRSTGNLLMEGNSFANPQMKLMENNFESYYVSKIGRDCHYVYWSTPVSSGRNAAYCWYVGATIYRQKPQKQIGEVISIVSAGEGIFGSFVEEFNNGTFTNTTADTLDHYSPNPATTEVSSFNQTFSIDPLALSSNPLFTIVLSSDGNNYTIEKRTVFTRLEEFVGSDHFCNQVGFCPPDIAEDRFADAEFQSVYLNEQITGLGATAYLENGNLSYADMFDALSQNAYEVARELNLEFGKPLSPDQIALLKKDIIWFEELKIDGNPVLNENGESILVPKL